MGPRLLTEDSSQPERPEFSAAGVTIWAETAALCLRRWLREPLLHFLLIGVLIFAIYEPMNPAANWIAQANRIVLTEDDLRQLAVQWLAQGRPPPAQ